MGGWVLLPKEIDLPCYEALQAIEIAVRYAESFAAMQDAIA